MLKIALCGMLGAGCSEVAQILTAKTGATVVNSETAVRQVVTDTTKSFREFQRRVVSGEVDIDRLIQSQLQEAAVENENLVVEGRSGFMLLDDQSFFKVLLVAAEETRARHIMERRSVTLEEAKAEIRHSDAERRALVERFFNKEWLVPTHYHIVLNTESLSFDVTASLVMEGYKAHVG